MPVTVAEHGNGGQARVGDAARASSDSDPAMILPAGAAGVDHHHYLPLPTFLGPPITPTFPSTPSSRQNSRPGSGESSGPRGVGRGFAFLRRPANSVGAQLDPAAVCSQVG